MSSLQTTAVEMSQRSPAGRLSESVLTLHLQDGDDGQNEMTQLTIDIRGDGEGHGRPQHLAVAPSGVSAISGGVDSGESCGNRQFSEEKQVTNVLGNGNGKGSADTNGAAHWHVSSVVRSCDEVQYHKEKQNGEDATKQLVVESAVNASGTGNGSGSGHSNSHDTGEQGHSPGHGGGGSDSSVDLWSSELKSVMDVDKGLSASAVESQRSSHGWNESVEKKTPWYVAVFRKFWGWVPWMIEAAMIISFVLGENENGAIIGFLLIVNASIALNEERKANEAVDKLKEKLQILSRCKRDAKWKELTSRELVPGDLVRVRHGDICPADIVLLDGNLEADQSALTGESELKYLKKNRLCYAGSVIKKGEASAIVWATGEKTFFGLTAKLVQNSKPSDHVQAIMNVFVKYFMSVVFGLVVITLIILAIRRNDVVAAIPLLLAVLITALPVALPVIFTVSMAVGSKTLVSHQVLVTRLNVLEDAPQMRILFSDKTGTLTLNKLTVQGLWCAPIASASALSHSSPSSTANGPQSCSNSSSLNSVSCSRRDLLFGAALCSRIENADPIDVAILKCFEQEEKDLGDVNTNSKQQHQASQFGVSAVEPIFQTVDSSAYACVRFLPFDAETRRTDATVVRGTSSGVEVLRVLKGAVATICELSGVTADTAEWTAVQNYVKESSAKGFRTIAVCVGRLHLDNMNVQHFTESSSNGVGDDKNVLNSLVHSFRLLGIVALYDPPRADTLDTLHQLIDLGITTKMLTGDNHLVACEIARQLQFSGKIINLEEEKKKVRADALAGTVDPDTVTEKWVLSKVFEKHPPLSDEISGFAQIFPSDKHAIVQFAQSQGIICGMTGDGVNDAPALKAAEVGVAMSNATDIAKMAASACMLAEGLTGILALVRVGRIVHRRASVWLIYKVAKSLVHSIFILVFYLAIGYFPINTLQVIALLLLMDFALISIATDRQQGAAKPTHWPLLQYFRIGCVLGILGAMQMMGIILYADYARNLSQDQLNTLSFSLMFFFGFFNMLSCREKVFFWRSIPSIYINCLFCLEAIAVLVCCSVGLPGLTGIGGGWIFASLAVTFGLFIVDDFVKGMYSLAFEKDFIKSG